MMTAGRYLGLALVATGVAARAVAGELQSATLDAWQQYLCSATDRMQARLDGTKPFLWLDESADRASRASGGEIVVAPVLTHGTQSVPDGLIHHWIGGAFLPGATIESLLAVVHDYDRYSEIYKPAVMSSKSLAGDESDREFSMVWQRHVVFVTATVRGRYHAHDVRLDSHRGYSVVDATRIQQIEDYRHPSEHLLPPDTGHGFLWRLHTVARYVERDGGVYLEIEAIALSRDIPSSVRWMAVPVVNRLSVSSLTATLSQTRQAVCAKRPVLISRKLR